MAQQSEDAAFESLIRYIQESRGVDFRGYKRTSLRRRVSLRMERLHCDDFADYHALLEADPQEFISLLNTVLINVTSFFRDPEAWESLKATVLPHLMDPQRGRDQLRVWSAGCATGEEPYSLAMLLHEALGPAAFSQRVKIYATDLDEPALTAARHARYAPHEVEVLPQAYRDRYFDISNGHYVVARDLRKAVIFGRHNIVHDAPISRIDLLVCRNLLIYLEAETQNQVLPRLHYALVDDGVLFLGKAETQLARSKLFEPMNVPQRQFRKVPQEWRRMNTGGMVVNADPARFGDELHVRLLGAIADNAAACYLAIDNADTLIFANLGARRLLDIAEGDLGRPFQDLLISYRPIELRSRIEEARKQGRPIRIEHQKYPRPPAEPLRLSIEVVPLFAPDGKPFAALLNFTDTTRLFELEEELDATHGRLESTVGKLQSANEELETTNEELQSTNEELEATNAELQSTNAELETTNEELRSANRDLEAAVDELRLQSEQFSAYRRHVEAILRSVGVGLVVVDQRLRVSSWNHWSENAWGLREAEVLGLSLVELDIGLPVQRLEAPLRTALGTGCPGDIALDALDRRGRRLNCMVRVTPLVHEDHTVHGALVLVEASGAAIEAA